MMNKKGNILDWFFILAVLMLIGVTLLVSYIVVDKVKDTGIFADDATASNAIDSAESTLLSLDNLMLFIIVGLSLFVLISSAIVYNHPAFFVVSIFLLFIAIVVAGVVSNSFWTLTNTSQLAETAALFPKLTFLMNNLPYYILLLGMAAAAVMFVGYQRQQ